MSVILDILALCMQCSVFFLVTLYHTTESSPLPDLVQMVQLVSSLVLISMRYWENFIDRDIGSIPIQSLKESLRVSRCKTYIFASLWKISLTLAFVYLLVPHMTPMGDMFKHIGNETVYG